MIALPIVDASGARPTPPLNGGTALRRALNGGALVLECEDIQNILAQRRPQLFLDRVLTLIPGQSGVGIKALTGNESGLAKRRHGFVFPSTFALEALAQLAAVVLDYDQSPQHANGRPKTRYWLLAGVESFEVAREITDLLSPLVVSVQLLAAEHTNTSGAAAGGGSNPLAVAGERRFAGQAYVGGQPFVTAVFQVAQLIQLEPTPSRALGF